MTRLSFPLALLLLAGCTSLPAPSVVDRTRIVGARVTIEGDPSRAWALPGERVSLTYLVLRSDPSEPLVTSWSACIAGPTVSGIPTCAGDALESVPAGEPGVAPPVFEIVVPDAARLGRFSGVLSTLASCAGGGSPVLDAETLEVACDAEVPGRGELSMFTIRVAPDLALANRHPSIVDEAFALAGDVAPQGAAGGEPTPWDAPSDVPLRDCAALEPSSALPTITTIEEPTERGEEPRPALTLSFSSTEDDRETYVTFDPIDGLGEARETLSFSHYATAGSFERNVSELDGTTPGVRTATVGWTPPPASEVPTGGLTVRFWWVARDGRGGLDVAERAACVVAAP